MSCFVPGTLSVQVAKKEEINTYEDVKACHTKRRGEVIEQGDIQDTTELCVTSGAC
jgi:hypothetical protein